MKVSLAARLRAETASLHSAAEGTPFMAELIGGRLDRAAYAALLANLLAIYAALEPALARHRADPVIAALDVAALARTQALRADLASLADVGPLAALQAATLRYVDRVHELDATRPELLVAHAYVRYLGDLSGGQLLRRIVARSPRLGVDVGTAFYKFGDAPAVAMLTRSFRSRLDEAPITDADAVVAEARLAFEWHRALFDELAAATRAPA